MKYIRRVLLLFAGVALAAVSAQAATIAITNHSFEADENTNSSGRFSDGERQDFGGELTDWITQSGYETSIAVGWKGITASELDPFPAIGQESQALSLTSGASVGNITSTAWSSFNVGDQLTLTISLGMPNLIDLDWNDETVFGITEGNTGLTVAHSGMIINNPATGGQWGDGTFTDVSFDYIVQASDLSNADNIGIFISAFDPISDSALNQSFFDNVRLDLTPIPEPSTAALFALCGLALLHRRR